MQRYYRKKPIQLYIAVFIFILLAAILIISSFSKYQKSVIFNRFITPFERIISKNINHSPNSKNLLIEIENTDFAELMVPKRDEKWFDVKIIGENEVLFSKVKKRGYNFYNWAGVKKSLTVKTDNSKFFLMNYKYPRFFMEFIAVELAKDLHILGQLNEMVNLQINNKKLGLYLLTEEFNESFLERHRLPIGPIYALDKYDYQVDDFYDVNFWKSIIKDQSLQPLQDLLRCINENCPDLKKMVHIDQILELNILYDLIGSRHVDAYHNHRWYFNPRTNKFSQLLWDIGYVEEKSKLFTTTNPIIQRLYSDPEIRKEWALKAYDILKNTWTKKRIEQAFDKFSKENFKSLMADKYLGSSYAFSNSKIKEEFDILRSTILNRRSNILTMLESPEVALVNNSKIVMTSIAPLEIEGVTVASNINLINDLIFNNAKTFQHRSYAIHLEKSLYEMQNHYDEIVVTNTITQKEFRLKSKNLELEELKKVVVYHD